MNVLNERWIVIDGSIYTERALPKKSEASGRMMDEPQRKAIAFNLNPEVARRIVFLHNAHQDDESM